MSDDECVKRLWAELLELRKAVKDAETNVLILLRVETIQPMGPCSRALSGALGSLAAIRQHTARA
jgi:hypothetical protein